MNTRATFIMDASVIAMNRLYKASQDSGRAAPHNRLIGLQLQDELVCGARLVEYSQHWLLRNLCTLPSRRRQGLAASLLQQLPKLELSKPIITFPLPHLDAFYLDHGFTPYDPQQLCPQLQQLLRQTRRKHSGIQAMVSQPQLG